VSCGRGSPEDCDSPEYRARGSKPRATRLVTIAYATVTEARQERRRLLAAVMLTAGKPFPVVAWQLGHASSKITATVYEHLLDGALLDDALEAFDRPRIAHRIAQADELEAEEVENRLQ
jgi:mRNA-degrading endonuclease toxin of MazEF toxin-antitoxin module